MESKKSEDASYPMLPPSFEESCGGQESLASRYKIHVEHRPGGPHIISVTTCSPDVSTQEKPLMDVPLDSKVLATMYNKEVPPPYEANPSGQQTVWSTEASKVHPGSPRIVGRRNRRLNVLCHRMIVFLSVWAGLYVCFKSLAVIATNHDTKRKLNSVANEAMQAVNVVEDIEDIPAEYEGKLIHVTGPISITAPLIYDECNISVRSVKVRRTIDESNVYSKSSYGDPYYSSKEWPETRLGKDYICERPNEYYSRSAPKNDEQIANEVKVGSLTLSSRLKQKFNEYYVISEKLVEINDFHATRVMYSDAGRNGRVFSFLGKLDKGVIEPYWELDYYTIILVMESENTASEMIYERVIYRLRELEAENFWSYITTGIGLVIPLIVILYYVAVGRAVRKTRRNQLMLSMPVQ